MKRALIHRYDNEPDILAVEERGYSDVYRSVTDDDFEIVIVVPTGAADTEVAVVGDAVSRQYTPNTSGNWPGCPDRYPVRVNVENVRYTTRDRVREAVIESGNTWAAAWTVICIDLDERILYESEEEFFGQASSSAREFRTRLTEEAPR